MASARYRLAVLLLVVFSSACASAEDRLAEGVALQTRGRYIEAVYRYAEALEKDATLVEAQERLLAAGDTAVMVAMDTGDDLERRGDAVGAAAQYRDIDRMLARARQVGMRIPIPAQYSAIRRAMFDNAINWQMVRGDEAAEDGRYSAARQFYVGARGDYLPSRTQTDESYEAETRVLLQWAEVQLEDMQPMSAHRLAQEAVEVRSSPPRDIVLAVRDLQARALAAGTVVIAVIPVMADAGVREYLGAEFEIQLDNVLSLDHWNRPPLFVDIADPLILRRELRGLLRGQLAQSPIVVGRALDLIGADVGVMIRLSAIEVVEDDVDTDEHEAIVVRNASAGGRALGRGRGQGRGRGRDQLDPDQPMDTVTYTTLRGVISYYVEADIILVDTSGREVNRFEASSRHSGPFQRGEFDGDPRILDLDRNEAPFFDPNVLAGQLASIEGALLEELAAAIAVGTYDQVLAGIR